MDNPAPAEHRPDLYLIAEDIAVRHEQQLHELEKRRVNHLLFLLLLGPTLAFLCFIAFGIVASLFPHNPAIAIAIEISSVIAGITIAWVALDNSFRHKAKQTLLYMTAERVGLRYRRGGFITLGDLYDHHVLPPYAQSRSEEGFSGRINGMRFEFQDFHIMPVRRAMWFDFRSYLWAHGFYGISIRIHLGRDLPGHTVLMPRFMVAGAIKRLFHEKFYTFHDINLVYRRFHRRYTVISRDQVEARYAFDPAMIERIMSMGEELNARWLEVSVKEKNMVIIASKNRNYFEPGHLLRPVTVMSIKRVLLDLDHMVAAIRALNLESSAVLGAK